MFAGLALATALLPTPARAEEPTVTAPEGTEGTEPAATTPAATEVAPPEPTPPDAPVPEASEPAPPEAPAAPPPPTFTLADDPDAPGGWTVRGPDGRSLDSAALAQALGDDETLTRLRRARTFARVQDGVLLGGVAAFGTAGVITLITAGPTVAIGARPDPQDYPDYADWLDDEDAWERRLARADTRDERIWTGVTLLSGAALCGVLVPLTGQEATLEARFPSLAYDRDDLRRRLSLLVTPTGVSVQGTLP